MAKISVSYALSSLVTVAATVTSVTASTDYSTYSYETEGASVSFSYEIIDTRPLPAESVTIIEETIAKTVTTLSDDDITMSESDTKEINLTPTDSVTVIESTFKAFTNPVDFDPSDDDVDPTPVTIAESDAKDIIVGELADSDLAGSPGLIEFTAYGDAQLSTAVKKYGSASLKLDGTGDYVLSDDTLDYGSNPFTVEMWVYPTSGTQDDVIFDSRVAYNDDNIMLRQSGSFLVAIRGNGILTTQNNVFSANTWTHLAVTRGGTFGNTYTIFVDGAVIHTVTSGGIPAAAELRIGADFNNLNGWAGYVDGFALSTADKYGGQNFTPASPVAVDPTTPIVLAFDGANGSTTIDNTGIPETVDVYITEVAAKNPEKPGITASVSTSEAINQFRPVKNVTDTATTSENIDRFDVTTEFDDTVTVTETSAKTITPAGKTDSVEMLGSNIKTFNSSVDFDPSDDDVDPDPITASDTINLFDVDKGLTDSASMAESDAKNLTRPDVADTATASDAPALNPEIPKSDSVTAVEGIKNNPELAKSDTATASETINKFDVRPSFTDSINTPTESIDEFDVGKTLTDSVTVTEVNVKTFTENVDFDRSDADADADPVSMTESLAANPEKPLSDTVAPSEAKVFNITTTHTDTLSVIESILTELILGESSYLYPSYAYASDGVDSPYLRGYHRGIAVDYATQSTDDGWQTNGEYMMFNEGFLGGPGGLATQWYGLEFTQDAFRFRNTDYEAQVNGADIQMNYGFIHGTALDDIKTLENTGVIGAAERVNNAIINADTITYGALTNAGLVVNFMYTDTDDTSCGGHYINETPLCAGAYSL